MTVYMEQFNVTVFENYEEFPLLMPRWGYVVSAFVLFLIGFFGFFLNLMVILLMFKDRQLWTPLNIILFNLVCSDFSVSIMGNPFTLISALFHRWVFGHTMCVLYGFFMALLGITSITTLTVISFERYMMVTRPFTSRHPTSKGAVLSVIFIWTYSLALTTPPLFGWGNYVNEAANISCSVNWHEQSFNTLTYILFLFAMGQILPFSIITFSYFKIIRTMRESSQRLGRVNRAEARATTMVFIMIISFTVSWTPYSVFALMEQFATEGVVTPGTSVIPALLAKSSICYDPLIYVGMNTQFRQSIKRIFGVHGKATSSHTEKGLNNTVLSPCHKLSGPNDATIRYNSSETNVSTPKRIDKSSGTIEHKPDVVVIEKTDKLFYKATELSTIRETKTISDAEKSGDTICDEESGSNNRKVEVFGKSCNLNDLSPILTMVDNEKFLFTKVTKRDSKDFLMNVYRNEGFEDHSTDDIKLEESSHYLKRSKRIKHSYSFDLGGIRNEGKRRKFSIETKLESSIAGKSFLDSMLKKIYDPVSKQDIVRTNLFTSDENVSDQGKL